MTLPVGAAKLLRGGGDVGGPPGAAAGVGRLRPAPAAGALRRSRL